MLRKVTHTENSSQPAETLNTQLGLSPYESRTYLAILTVGPMSPSKIAQQASIPRPRIYDVLQSLVQKGLIAEQSGRPVVYAAIEPSDALRNLMANIESETTRQIEEKKRVVRTLAAQLSRTYEKTRDLRLEKSRVWSTKRDTAFISLYAEAIRNCEKEVLIASTSPSPPEKEIIEAVKSALKKGRSIRVVRQATELWTTRDIETYEQYIDAGTQVRYLDIKEIPLRFMIFDDRDIILVLPSETESPALEALWLRIPPLANILHREFEDLWKKGTPMKQKLKEMKEKRQLETQGRSDEA